MKPLRLIVVEDSEDDTFLLLRKLKKGGYEVDHVRVETADQLEAALGDGPWDLIICDHVLPSFSAPEALKIVNNSGSNQPFIIVSNIIGEDMAVSALKAGAHDYIMKNNLARLIPVVERELYDARVRLERKKALEALRESEARFRRMAENARDLIYRLRLKPDFKIEYISPSVEIFTGYRAVYFYNNPREAIERLFHDQDRKLFEKILHGKISLSEPIIFCWTHRDGSIRWSEHRNVPINDNTGAMVAIEGIARDITGYIANEQELKKSHARIEALSSRILSAMEEERARLARELHDELGQALTAVKLDLQLVDEEYAADRGRKNCLKESIDLVDYTISLVRRQSVSLRPPALDHMGLIPAIEEMIGGFENRTGICADLISNGFSERFSRPVEIALYRCIQESLTNIARHARAETVTIRFNKENGILDISVTDDGIGFEPEKMEISAEHIGLTGMKERVKLLFGHFEIDSAPGEGTTIMIKIPWKEWIDGEAEA